MSGDRLLGGQASLGRDGSFAVSPVVTVWLLLAALTGLPYLRASLSPPPGRVFKGSFFFVDDHYLYLSYVQQAEKGSFLFQNKLVGESHPGALINLEWWAVGRISGLLGHRPFLAYRVFGLVALLSLLAAIDRWLVRAGLPKEHRLPALLLVSTGGGFGGILFSLQAMPVARCLDLATGLFPFNGILGNPHFVAGTSLLLWSLLAYQDDRSPREHLVAALLGSALGLVRPYDLALLVGIRAGSVLLTEPLARWPVRLAPLAGLAPVTLYNYWLFYMNPAFAFYASAPYLTPGVMDLALAMGPAAVLAAAGLWNGAAAPTRAARIHLLVWCVIGAVLILARPVPFSLQFLVGIGVPLLSFAALALARLRPAATLLAVALLGTTAAVAIRLVLSPLPYFYAPAERMQAARALTESCRPGERVWAPVDIGLYVAGLTDCRAVVSHVSHPAYAERELQVRRFYEGGDLAFRTSLLDRYCARYVVLPGEPGEVPTAWLGGDTAFRRLASVGRGDSILSIYGREVRGCPTG